MVYVDDSTLLIGCDYSKERQNLFQNWHTNTTKIINQPSKSILPKTTNKDIQMI